MSSTMEHVSKWGKEIEEQNLEEKLPTETELITAYLSKTDRLRMYIPPSPGSGHQATSILCMRRMIEHGFKGGLLEIYYEYGEDVDGKSANLQKLLKLIPEAFENPLSWRIGDVHGSLIEYKTPPLDPWPFGFSGAIDTPKNIANLVNVGYFLQLQPFAFPNPIGVWQHGASKIINLEHIKSLSNLKFASLYTDAPVLTEKDWQEQAKQATANKMATLAAILEVYQAPTLNCFPVYGLETNLKTSMSIFTLQAQQPTVLFNLMAGALAIQRTAVDAARKPVLLVLISTLTVNSRTQLMKLLKRELAYPALNAYIQKFFDGRWEILPGEDPGTPEKIKALPSKPGGVTVVELGGIISPFFNNFYARTRLPAILEGAGTFNFVVNVGTPYLLLRDKDTEPELAFPSLSFTGAANPLAAIYIQSVLSITKTTLLTWNTQLRTATEVGELGDRIPLGEKEIYRVATEGEVYPAQRLPDILYGDALLASLDPISELRKYWGLLPFVYHTHVNDKLIRAFS